MTQLQQTRWARPPLAAPLAPDLGQRGSPVALLVAPLAPPPSQQLPRVERGLVLEAASHPPPPAF